jgi:hypothetical protein
MTATGWARQTVGVLGVLAVQIALVACPAVGVRDVLRHDPAVITLPPRGTPGAFDKIIHDLGAYTWGPAHYAVCTGCQSAQDVSIRFTGKTKDVKPSDGPATLRIVALIRNWSTQEVLHQPSGVTFKPNTTYLMWAHRTKAKRAVWGFIELGSDYTDNPQPLGYLDSCGHPWKPSLHDDADFADCSKYAFLPSVPVANAAGGLMATISAPGWIACDPDCCTGTKTAVSNY